MLIISGGAAWNRYSSDYITTDIDINVMTFPNMQVQIMDARNILLSMFSYLIGKGLIPENYTIQIIDRYTVLNELAEYNDQLEKLYEATSKATERYVSGSLRDDPLQEIITGRDKTLQEIEKIRQMAVSSALNNPNNPVKIAFYPPNSNPLPLIEFTFTPYDPRWTNPYYVPYPIGMPNFFNESNGLFYLNLDILRKKLYKNLKDKNYLDRYYAQEKNITYQKLQSWKMQLRTDMSLRFGESPSIPDYYVDNLTSEDLIVYINQFIKDLTVDNTKKTAKSLLAVKGKRYPEILSSALERYCKDGLDQQITAPRAISNNCEAVYGLWKELYDKLIDKIGYQQATMIQDFVFGEGF